MRKTFYHLLILSFLVSCTDNDDNVGVEIGDRFTHDIPDCDNSGNTEMNCREFLEIIVNGQADLLYSGSDIVRRFEIRFDGDKLHLEQELTSSFALPFHFRILANKNLERSDNGDIWIKEN